MTKGRTPVLAAAGLAIAVGLVGAGFWWWNSRMSASSTESVESNVEVEFAPPTESDAFDGDNAMRYLTDMCKLGQRLTASKPMAKQQAILQKHFEALGAKVELQKFTGTQPSRPSKQFECANLIVRWGDPKPRRVLLSCHYDTRPNADQEPPMSTRRGRFLGANDGAGSVALLMELGRQMPKLKTNVGVDFVFFDAEEYILDTRKDSYFLGSEHFVKQYTKADPGYKYEAVVNLDMVAGKGLHLPWERNSASKAGPLVKEIWDLAAALGVLEFEHDYGHEVRDDHLPFLEAGIPAVDVIDFDYPHWHRLTDLPENCSGRSMSQVAKVMAEWMRRRK